jgi:hypothetical protein
VGKEAISSAINKGAASLMGFDTRDVGGVQRGYELMYNKDEIQLRKGNKKYTAINHIPKHISMSEVYPHVTIINKEYILLTLTRSTFVDDENGPNGSDDVLQIAIFHNGVDVHRSDLRYYYMDSLLVTTVSNNKKNRRILIDTITKKIKAYVKTDAIGECSADEYMCMHEMYILCVKGNKVKIYSDEGECITDKEANKITYANNDRREIQPIGSGASWDKKPRFSFTTDDGMYSIPPDGDLEFIRAYEEK